VREARSLGLKGDDRFIVVEGSEAALARAVELLKDVAPPLEGAKADDVYRRLRSQDEQAASGMGLIFGPYVLQTTRWSSTPAGSTSFGKGSNSRSSHAIIRRFVSLGFAKTIRKAFL